MALPFPIKFPIRNPHDATRMGELSQVLTPKEQRPGNSQAHGPCKLPQNADIVYLESGLF